MAKSPAFQFYPDDFMGGKPGIMSPEQTHVYIWLLCLDWNQNGFFFDERTLARWCRVTPGIFRRAWKIVQENFSSSEGRWYNERLSKERIKQAKWREKSAKGGRSKRQPPVNHPSDMVGTTDEPNGNIPLPLPLPITTKTPRAVAPWMGLVRKVWREIYPDAEPLKGTAKTLAPLFSTHPEVEVCEWLRQTLRDTNPKYLNLAKAVSTYSGPQPRFINGSDDALVMRVLGITR